MVRFIGLNINGNEDVLIHKLLDLEMYKTELEDEEQAIEQELTSLSEQMTDASEDAVYDLLAQTAEIAEKMDLIDVKKTVSAAVMNALETLASPSKTNLERTYAHMLVVADHKLPPRALENIVRVAVGGYDVVGQLEIEIESEYCGEG